MNNPMPLKETLKIENAGIIESIINSMEITTSASYPEVIEAREYEFIINTLRGWQEGFKEGLNIQDPT